MRLLGWVWIKFDWCPYKRGNLNTETHREGKRWKYGGLEGEGSGNPLQYSCLENPMDGAAWWAAVHGVVKSRTQLSDFTFTFMHWRRKWQPTPVFLPGESQGWGEPGGLPSLGSHRVRHDWSDLAVSRLKTSKAKLTPSYFSSHNTSANLQTASPTSLELQHENYSLVFHFLYFLLW